MILSITVSAKDIAVVISNKFELNSLTQTEVKRIFLAKSKHLHGKKVKVIELKDAPCKDVFYKTITNKTEDELHSYWVTLVFTGKAKPPIQIKSVNSLLDRISEDKLTITYLPVDKVTDAMRVLYTLKN